MICLMGSSLLLSEDSISLTFVILLCLAKDVGMKLLKANLLNESPPLTLVAKSVSFVFDFCLSNLHFL